jgi:hypothetical protein
MSYQGHKVCWYFGESVVTVAVSTLVAIHAYIVSVALCGPLVMSLCTSTDEGNVGGAEGGWLASTW